MSKKTSLSRRTFLASSAASAFSFHVVPNTVIGAPSRPAPSDQLRFGHIGVGGRGSGFLRPGQTIAICDVDEKRLNQANDRVGGNAKLYTDYRKMLEQDDLDAVFVTSPDHWHALQTIHACEAGKDVYVEKPASKTIEEGRAMVEAANRYGRVVQVGSQGRSQEGAYHAKKYIRNGQIGDVKRIECWHYDNPIGNWVSPETPPDYFDYEAWVGPMRWLPYNPRRTHGSFRFLFESGGGLIRDRGAHVMSVAMWIMESDHTGPVTIEAKGRPVFDGIYNCPLELEVIYTFKDPDWTMVWAQPGKPQEYPEFDFVRGTYGAKYYGDDGNLVVTYGDTPHTDTEQKAKDYQPPENGVNVFHSPGHRENFENCIRTRDLPIMHIEAGHRVATLCILGNIAWWLGRKLEWDPVNERVKNDEEANRLLFKPGRGEWQI